MDQRWYRNVIHTIFQDYHTHCYSSDINPSSFWLFGLLKWILKDRNDTSIDKIEKIIQVH
jgi:hypothetical protein